MKRFSRFLKSAPILLVASAAIAAGPAMVDFTVDELTDQVLFEGYRLAHKGLYGSAIKQFTRVLLRDPGNRLAREEVARLSLALKNGAERPSDGSAAISESERGEIVGLAYRALKKTSPDTIERMLAEAREYEKKQQNTLATRSYLKALGMEGLELENKHEIERRLRRASQFVDGKIEALPESTRGLFREAFTLMSVGDWENSVEIWQNFAAQTPEDREIQELLALPEAQAAIKQKHWVFQARFHVQRGEMDEAEVFFRKVMDNDPTSREAQVGIEKVAAMRAARRKDEVASGHITDAERYMKKGLQFKAIDSLLEALKEDPGNKPALDLLAEIQKSETTLSASVPRRERSFSSPARADIIPVDMQSPAESSVIKNPAKAETHYQRGLVYYGLRNYREALSEWKMAVDYDPTFQKAVRALERVKTDLRQEM